MTWLRCIVWAVVAVVAVPALVVSAAAIDVQPSEDRILAALAKGKEAAKKHRSPDAFYTRFGEGQGLRPSGFLMTKLGSLSAMAVHMALRGLEPGQSDIAQVLGEATMPVGAILFGDHPSFATGSYVVLEQGGKTIKPVMVRVDGQASRSPAWPDRPRFTAKVVAFFNYADFDPAAVTTVTLFPPEGGEVRFTLDFAQIE